MKSVLKELNNHIQPSSFVDYKTYLLSTYQYLKANIDKYTYPKFATDLGFAPTGIINQIIHGRRKLSSKMTEKIAKAMQLSNRESKYLMTLVQYTHAIKMGDREKLFEKLVSLKSSQLTSKDEKDVLEYFREWYHPVIRELAGLDEFQGDASWIASKLTPSIRPSQAQKSLELLVRLGLLRLDREANKYFQTDKNILTPDAVKGLAIAGFHRQMIDLGSQSLSNFDGQERSVTAITIPADRKLYEEIQAKIIEFQKEQLKNSECNESSDRVYQLNIQLFPVSDK